MRAVSPAAVGALAALFTHNASLEGHKNFASHPSAMKEMKESLLEINTNLNEEDIHLALAHACLRQQAYRALTKFSRIVSKCEMEDALVNTKLPEDLRAQLLLLNPRPPGIDSPKTWNDELGYLRDLSATKKNPRDWLWRHLLNHPMTEYIPVQCPNCRHVVPDSYSPSILQTEADAQVGLLEVAPTGTELGLQSGWFRGPRGPVVFQIECTECQYVYKWYRSGHPKVLLSPHKRGRLCGEQEDLRLSLAYYLGVSVRMVLPLDWDHVWTEFCSIPSDYSTSNCEWQVDDDSARNFACRLDEGIGAWTGVLALHPDPKLCEDVTDMYLRSQLDGGRADNEHSERLDDYRSRIMTARSDESFTKTQTGTGAGYLIRQAQLSSEEVTDILRQAANDYMLEKNWWDLTA